MLWPALVLVQEDDRSTWSHIDVHHPVTAVPDARETGGQGLGNSGEPARDVRCLPVQVLAPRSPPNRTVVLSAPPTRKDGQRTLNGSSQSF
jgi:hypothetical protein